MSGKKATLTRNYRQAPNLSNSLEGGFPCKEKILLRKVRKIRLDE